MPNNSRIYFKSLLEEKLDNQVDVFLFWKGRVALYAILKAIGVKKDDEVIQPALTCVVVANSILYLGAKPVYVDVDPKTYNIDPNLIEKEITVRTKVILAQNTFGLSSDLDPIHEIANRHNLLVIEDCAHGFGGTYRERLNGTIADASFFSTQWNKPFSTGIGGIAVTRNPEVAEKLTQYEIDAISPSRKDTLSLKFLIFARDFFLFPGFYWIILKSYRFLSKYNLILGSSQGYELKSPDQPPDFMKGLSIVQAEKGIKEICKIEEVLKHRRYIAKLYSEMLMDLGIEPPYEPDYASHTFLKYPLLVNRRDEFFKKAEKNRIEIGDWFVSPLHPIKNDLEPWNYSWGTNPVAERLSRHIVNLPTHLGIDEKQVDKMVSFLKANRHYLYRVS